MKESFNDLYTRLYRENFAELEAMRAKEKRTSVGIIFVVATGFILASINPIFLILIIIAGIIWATQQIKVSKSSVKDKEKSYKEVFKEKVVKPMIENAFENASYNPKDGLSSFEYLKGGYDERHDRFRSEDLVLASFNTEERENVVIKFSEVHTEREYKDEDGHTKYTTLFHGLAGNFILAKDIQTQVYIRSNWRVISFGKSNKVKMDMPEFEKIFDVESEDAIMTMRILTADIMAEMIELYKKYKYRFEISILKDTVHMRLATGPVFEPSIFKSSMEYKTLERYYLVLKALISIAKHIHDTVARIEV